MATIAPTTDAATARISFRDGAAIVDVALAVTSASIGLRGELVEVEVEADLGRLEPAEPLRDLRVRAALRGGTSDGLWGGRARVQLRGALRVVHVTGRVTIDGDNVRFIGGLRSDWTEHGRRIVSVDGALVVAEPRPLTIELDVRSAPR